MTNRNERLYRAIKRNWALPISKFYKLLKSGSIYISGQREKKNIFIKDGDLIYVWNTRISKVEKRKIITNITPKVIYENQSFEVIKKKPGIACQSGLYLADRNYSTYYRSKKLFPIHRLDFYTEGILIYSKTHSHAVQMGEIFKNRLIEKYYLAYIDKTLSHFTYIQSKEKKFFNNKFAASYILPLSKNIVLVKILTGKKHQIRIHLASLGTPLRKDKYKIKQYDERAIIRQENIIINKKNLLKWVNLINNLIKKYPIKITNNSYYKKILFLKLLNNREIYPKHYLLSHSYCKWKNFQIISIPDWKI